MEARGTGASGIAGRFDLKVIDSLEAENAPQTGRTSELTARERDVLEALAEGRATEEIAKILCVSPHTIRSRVKTVLRKLGARNREHAVAIALTEGVIHPKL